MKLDEAKIVYATGGIGGARIEREPMGMRWIIVFTLKAGITIDGMDCRLTAARGNVRTFSDADRALAQLAELGVKTVTVQQ